MQGQTLGYLGLLLTRQGDPGEGRKQLDAGKDVLQSVKDELSLAALRCASAEAHLLNGDTSQALADLAEGHGELLNEGAAIEPWAA